MDYFREAVREREVTRRDIIAGRGGDATVGPELTSPEIFGRADPAHLTVYAAPGECVTKSLYGLHKYGQAHYASGDD